MGKPAARISDSVSSGKIVTGSATVLIGSQGGVACAECPGGMAVGSPVNPSLGAKVLAGAGELDFALPGALPLVWQRQYSSYVNAKHGGECGVLGYGWYLPFAMHIQLQADSTELFDAQGRTITFEESLEPGQSLYSPSEDLWLLRGGALGRSASEPLNLQAEHELAPADTAPLPTGEAQQGLLSHWSNQAQWQHIPRHWASHAGCIIAASGASNRLWVFAPAPKTGQWRLYIVQDRFGRQQSYHYAANAAERAGPAGPNPRKDPAHQGLELPEHLVTHISDGAGRQYQLHYQPIMVSAAQQAAAEQSATQSEASDATAKALCSPGHQGQAGWQREHGWRLVQVNYLDGSHAGAGSPLVRYHYSSAGDLVAVQDRSGHTVREFEYVNHLMVGHRRQAGPWHRYTYESAGQQPNQGILPGAKVLQQWNEAGLDYQFEYRQSSTEPPKSHTIVTDSLGRKDTYYFEGEAGLKRLLEHHRPDGSILRRGYDSFSRLSHLQDPLGRTSYIRRDGQGRIIGSQGPDGSQTKASYNAQGQLAESQSAAGLRTSYHYDDYARLVEVRVAAGTQPAWSEHYQYPDIQAQRQIAEYPSQITDAKGNTRQLEWSAQGQLLRYSDCSGQTTHYSYDRWGQLEQVRDAQGHNLRYERNAQGQITAVYRPDGSSESYEHDAAGRIVRMLPSSMDSGDAVVLRYDLWGRIIQREQGSAMLQFAYDSAGRLVRLVNENAASSEFHWDAMDRLVQESGFDQRLQTYRYDLAGQLLEHTDGAGSEQASTSYYHWDQGGRLQSRSIQMAGSQSSEHHYEWNAAGQLLRASVQTVVQASTAQAQAQLLSEVILQRNAQGQLTGEVQRLYSLHQAEPEHEWQIHHELDVLGNRTASHTAEFGQLDYLLYGSGHLHGIQLQTSELISFERDQLHRETLRQWHSGDQQPLQRQQSYDALGRLSAQKIQGLQSPKLSHSAAALQLAPLVGQLSERHYHYDSLGQLSAIQSPAGLSQYRYDQAGRLIAAHNPHNPQGPSQSWRFDPAGNRLPQDEHSSGVQDWSERVRQHLSDPQFNLLQPDGHNAHSEVQCWPDNRVGFDAQRSYRYDSKGNRISSQSQPGERAQSSSQPNAADSDSQQILVYDSFNQLIEVQQWQGGQHTHSSHYRYDPFGRRLSQKTTRHAPEAEASGTVEENTYYGWDGDRLVCSKDAYGTTSTVYEPGGFTPLLQVFEANPKSPASKPAGQALSAEIRKQLQAYEEAQQDMQEQLRQLEHLMPADQLRELKQQALQQIKQQLSAQQLWSEQAEQAQRTEQASGLEIRYYHCDQIGTPLALTDEQGVVVWAAQYDPWGNVVQEFNAQPTRIRQDIRMAGQQQDRHTGLHYNRFRYYDPQLGAYVNQDPIRLKGGNNLYAYPLSPLSYIDPLGLDGFGMLNSAFGDYGRSQVSLGQHMAQQGASAAEITDAMQKNASGYRAPVGINGTASVEAGISGHVIAGGGASVGLAAGKNRKEIFPRVCVYFTPCQTLGPGATGGVNLNGAVTNAAPSTGATYHAGAFGSGGFLGKGNGYVLSEIANPSNVTASGGIGIGGGGGGGLMTCQQYTLCTPSVLKD